MTWEIRLPIGNANQPLTPGAIHGLASHLDGEERAIARTVLVDALTRGIPTVGEALGEVEGMTQAERHELLNEARESAGLASTERIDAERQIADFERVSAAAGRVERSEGGFGFLSCSHPGCVVHPQDEHGSWLQVSVRKWWCALHASESQPGDDEQWRPPLALDPSGGLVDLEEQEFERARAEHLERQAKVRRIVREAEREADAKYLPNDDHWLPSGPGWWTR
jgi:hypothetical protein